MQNNQSLPSAVNVEFQISKTKIKKKTEDYFIQSVSRMLGKKIQDWSLHIKTKKTFLQMYDGKWMILMNYIQT